MEKAKESLKVEVGASLIAILFVISCLTIFWSAMADELKMQALEMVIIVGFFPYFAYVLIDTIVKDSAEKSFKQFVGGILVDDFWALGVGMCISLIGVVALSVAY